MPLMLYPQSDDAGLGTYEERVDQLMEAAERFKAAVLESSAKSPEGGAKEIKVAVPKDITIAFNWEIIALLLRQIRELPEADKSDKALKNRLLTKMADVYEVLRGAKMSKLEAVRLALISEANQLADGSSRVA